MHAILPKVCGYLGIILVSYALKRKGIVNQQAYSIFSSLMLKLTLPCAIIINMNLIIPQKFHQIHSRYYFPRMALRSFL
jgi:predicted permease